MVKHVADRIPTYVKNDKTGRKQVLHHARLLLWHAEYDGEPIRVNHIMISASLPGTSSETQLQGSDRRNAVLRRLIYGLNWPMQKSSNRTTHYSVQEVLTGAPQNGTGHRIPDKRKKKRWLVRHRTDREDIPVR